MTSVRRLEVIVFKYVTNIITKTLLCSWSFYAQLWQTVELLHQDYAKIDFYD